MAIFYMFSIFCYANENKEINCNDTLPIVKDVVDKDLSIPGKVYLTDSVTYHVLFKYLNNENCSYVSQECLSILMDYGKVSCLRKYRNLQNNIHWEKYPNLQALAFDTIKPSKKFRLWVNATLEDKASIDILLKKFEESSDYYEKMMILNSLAYISNKRLLKKIFKKVVKEGEKNIYYKGYCVCFNSAYYIYYWLLRAHNDDTHVLKMYKKFQKMYVPIYPNDLRGEPKILPINKDINHFLETEKNGNYSNLKEMQQFVRDVKKYVKELYGLDVKIADDNIIKFCYIVEIDDEDYEDE